MLIDTFNNSKYSAWSTAHFFGMSIDDIYQIVYSPQLDRQKIGSALRWFY